MRASVKADEKVILTTEEAMLRKTEYRAELDMLVLDVNNHLKREGSFKKADELIDRAYKLHMGLNHFRIQVAHANNIKPKVRQQLVQVIALIADGADGIYRGMTSARNGGDYEADFRYSTACAEALAVEDDALEALIK